MIYLRSLVMLVMFAVPVCVSAQTIVDPVAVPYFVIKRQTTHVQLPENLGRGNVSGFAVITVSLDSLGKLKNSKVEKLKLSGQLNISYHASQDIKNHTIRKYESFLKKSASKIKIIKSGKRKPPETSTITFLVRF